MSATLNPFISALASVRAEIFAPKPVALRPHLREPHPKQRLVIYSAAKRKVIRAGRRGGKTVGVSQLAVKAFLAGRRVLYATPTADQITRFWFEVKRALQTDIDAKVLTKNETEHFIERPRTENRIRAKTAWNADSLRGDYADLLILDEYQLMNEDAWKVVGAPMLLDNDGDAVFVYTPPSIRSAGVTKAHDPMHASKLFKKAAAHEALIRSGYAGKLNGHTVDQRQYPDAALMTMPRWQTFHFSSLDNPHLSEDALEEITQDITRRVYEAEILAIDKDDNPLALWTRDMIEPYRVTEIPVLQRIVVGIDPSVTSEGAEAGIIAAGVGLCRCKGYLEPHGFVLDDVSLQGSPQSWASTAVALYNKLHADAMVAEQNNGGEMVQVTISTIQGAPFVRLLHASRGKITRAEPIAAIYERGLVHHVGTFPLLEDEMCQFDGSSGADSPNRYDAMVWTLTEMLQSIRAGSPALSIDERNETQLRQWGFSDIANASETDKNDPAWWFSRELNEARLRNRVNVEGKWGMGKWEAMEEQAERRISPGMPDLWR